MSVACTYLGSSGWLIDFPRHRVLVDPWLTGNLSFPPGPWLIEGTLTKQINIPEEINLLLLTQGLADHTHPPSLELLPKKTPVIGSPSASKVARNLGFENVCQIKPGENQQIEDLLIQATVGAPVPNLENGYILQHPSGSLYIEPHGFLDNQIKSSHMDAVITPVVNLKLPIAGKFIKGKDVLPELIRRFSPLTVFASTTGGDSTFTGLINGLITVEGSPEEAFKLLSPETVFIDPAPGKKYLLSNYKN